MKKVFIIITLLITQCFQGTFIKAEGRTKLTTPLSFFDSVESITKDGYSWDNENNTLTLSGLNLEVSGAKAALSVGDGVRIVLAENSVNTITYKNGSLGAIHGGMNYTIEGTGKLNISSSEYGIISINGSIGFKGSPKVFISSQKTGIFCYNGATSICDQVNLTIDSQSDGIYVGTLEGPNFTVIGTPNISIKAEATGIKSIDSIDINGGSFVIDAETGIYADEATIGIINCQNMEMDVRNNGILVDGGKTLTIENTPIKIKADGSCLSSMGKISIINSVVGLYPGIHGAGIRSESDDVYLKNASLEIFGGNKGIYLINEITSLTLENSSLKTNSLYPIEKGNVSLLNNSQLILEAQTTSSILANATWKIEQGSTFRNNGKLMNYGMLVNDGLFYNNGLYVHETKMPLNGNGNFKSDSHSEVLTLAGLDEETTKRLVLLGKVLQIYDKPLDYTQSILPKDGDGFAWDSKTKTLTLSGALIKIKPDKDDTPIIHLPKDAKIYLKANTTTNIENLNELLGNAIIADGDLLIYGEGNLNLVANGTALEVQNELTVCGPMVRGMGRFGINAGDIHMVYARVGIRSTDHAALLASGKIKIADAMVDFESVHDFAFRVWADKNDKLVDKLALDGISPTESLTLYEDATSQTSTYFATVGDASQIPLKAWATNTYQEGHAIVFDGNNGEAIEPLFVEHKKTINLPQPIKKGYTFLGWFEGDEKVTEQTPILSGMSLQAHWGLYIDASATKGGTITPHGKHIVSEGATQTFTMEADAGYELEKVELDGKNIGKELTYTIKNIDENHSLVATFRKIATIQPLPDDEQNKKPDSNQNKKPDSNQNKKPDSNQNATNNPSPDTRDVTNNISMILFVVSIISIIYIRRKQLHS